MNKSASALEELIGFIKLDETNFKERLGAHPYHIRVVEEKDKLVFGYTQGLTDFNVPMCRVCRGLVLDAKSYKVIARGFDKSFNYFDEKYVDLYDIFSGQDSVIKQYVRFEEKVDGSLIKLYFDIHSNVWIFGGNNALNSKNVPLRYPSHRESTFLDSITNIFIESGFTSPNFDFLDNYLNRGYTYCFEFVSPRQPIVVNYGEKSQLFFLAKFENGTTRPIPLVANPNENELFRKVGVKYPETYYYVAVSEILNFLKSDATRSENVTLFETFLDTLYSNGSLPKDNGEGFILSFWKGMELIHLKVKHKSYLSNHHIASFDYFSYIFSLYQTNNGNIMECRRVINEMLEEITNISPFQLNDMDKMFDLFTSFHQIIQFSLDKMQILISTIHPEVVPLNPKNMTLVFIPLADKMKMIPNYILNLIKPLLYSYSKGEMESITNIPLVIENYLSNHRRTKDVFKRWMGDIEEDMVLSKEMD